MGRWTAVPVIFLLIIGAWLLPQAIDNDPPGRYTGDIEVVTTGDYMHLSYGWERHRSCDAVVGRVLVSPSGVVTTLAPIAYTASNLRILQQVSRDRITVVIPMPIRVERGMYQWLVNVKYECNAWQRMFPLYVQASVPFELPQ